MDNVYFVKYSFQDESQPLKRVHVNCNLYLVDDVLDCWDILDELKKQEYICDKNDVVIDFMIKVREM